jgi:tetratricopeptide (TPR) repeat protein
MLELNMPHLDDFTLLRYVAEDLDEKERSQVLDHLGSCETCQKTIGEIQELDRQLKAVAANPETRTDFELEELPDGDPFRQRPSPSAPTRAVGVSPTAAADAVIGSEQGLVLAPAILEALKTSPAELEALLARLFPDDLAHRFGLLYALQEAGTLIAEAPSRFLSFAERSLARLREWAQVDSGAMEELERLVPLGMLFGQAHQLVGQASLWTAQYENAGSHFVLAYRSFAKGPADESSLAIVEQLEAQRRSFVGRGSEARILARRAAVTFQVLGMEDAFARAKAAEGLALAKSNAREEALASYLVAIPIFERMGLWTNYVVTVNSLGVSLGKLGRLDEARREFARALRRVSREKDAALVASLRHSLAEVLFSAGRFREAGVSVARAIQLYEDAGLPVNALRATLFEVEAWARAGDTTRALHRLGLFRAALGRHRYLDPSVVREMEDALSGTDPDYEALACLRERADGLLAQRFLNLSA